MVIEAKHTPGPWQRSGVRVKLGAEDCIAVGPDGAAIAFLPIGKTDKEHASAIKDADLIKAAPDLLQALQDIHRELAWSHLPPSKQSLADNAAAAIAKATGSAT